jgi:anti-anti-sigma factor
MSEPQTRYVSCSLVVLRVSEPQMSDAVADAVCAELVAVYQQTGAVHAVIDLAEVQYLSSAGIRCLLGLLREVRQRKGRLVLCNLSREVEEVLVVTRLVGTTRGIRAPFEQHADVPSAIANL